MPSEPEQKLPLDDAAWKSAMQKEQKAEEERRNEILKGIPMVKWKDRKSN